MHYWLFKSEPTTFSIDDLGHRPQQTEPWNGVRNYQVRNMLRDKISKGDLAFFYHSSCPLPGIMGIIEIVSGGYPDDTAWDPQSPYYDPKSLPENPRWFMVDVKLVEKFARPVLLNEIKKSSVLAQMIILRKGNRLSITPVTTREWQVIIELAHRS